MWISLTSTDCTGYESFGSIMIDYVLMNGVQKSYHDNPTIPFMGKRTRTYIPDTEEGRNLLKRYLHSWYLNDNRINEYLYVSEYSP